VLHKTLNCQQQIAVLFNQTISKVFVHRNEKKNKNRAHVCDSRWLTTKVTITILDETLSSSAIDWQQGLLTYWIYQIIGYLTIQPALVTTTEQMSVFQLSIQTTKTSAILVHERDSVVMTTQPYPFLVP